MVVSYSSHLPSLSFSTKSIISMRRHIVIRPVLQDAGYRPDFTPAHHVDLLTGNKASTAGNLKNPILSLFINTLPQKTLITKKRVVQSSLDCNGSKIKQDEKYYKSSKSLAAIIFHQIII